MLGIVQDKINRLHVPDFPYTGTDFTLEFRACEGCSPIMESITGTVCNDILTFELEHVCESTTKFNLDIGQYFVAIKDGDTVLVNTQLRIFSE